MKKTEFDRLNRKIKKLPKEVIKECYQKGMKNVLHRVSSSAKLKAPGNNGDLRNSIKTHIFVKGDVVKGKVYSRAEHAVYVEFGTGPKGSKDHSGISPHVNVNYRNRPWFIPGKVLDKDVVNKYHFPEIKLKSGDVLYWTNGQKAQPFLYPAISEIEPYINSMLGGAVIKAMRRVAKE